MASLSLSMRARRIASFVTTAVGLGAIGLSLVSSPTALTACSEKAPAPVGAKPVVIGVTLGLSGRFDSRAAPMRQAILVAQAQLNAAGGVLGRPVEFRIVDDKGDEASGVQGVAQAFVADRVAGVIGPIGSGQVLAVQGIFSGAKIPQISPSATAAELSTVQPEAERFLFRTAPSDNVQGRAAVYFAMNHNPTLDSDAGVADSGSVIDSGSVTDSGVKPDGGTVDSGVPVSTVTSCKNMAILSVDNAYGNGLAVTIRDTFKNKGGTVVDFTAVPVPVAADYKDIVNRVLDTHPDCQVLAVYQDVGAQYMKDLAAARAERPTALPNGFFVIGTDGVYNAGFIENSRADKANALSASAAEGTFGTFPDTNPDLTEYNEFKTLFKSYFPFAPGVTDTGPYASNTFDAAILMALAIESAGTDTDGAKIRDELTRVSSGGQAFSAGQLSELLTAIREKVDVDYKGASGRVNFDGFGDVVEDFIVWRVVGGQFTVVRHVTSAELE